MLELDFSLFVRSISFHLEVAESLSRRTVGLLSVAFAESADGISRL